MSTTGDGILFYLVPKQKKSIIYRDFLNFFPTPMIRLSHRVSPVQLSILAAKTSHTNQRFHSGEADRVFRFREILILDSHTCDTIWGDFSAGNLQSKQSFSGWVGFFGYEFLLTILEYNSMQKGSVCAFSLVWTPSKPCHSRSRSNYNRILDDEGAGNC